MARASKLRGSFPIAVVIASAALGATLALPVAAAAQGSIQVRAATPRGVPASGTVTARGQEGSYSCTLTSGQCVMSGVRAGSYTVTLTAPGRAPERRRVTVGSSRVSVVFAVADAASRPVKSVGVHPGSGVEARPVTRPVTPGATPDRPVRSVEVAARSLSAGTRLVIQGTATHPRGTPAVGSVEVRQGTTLVGRAQVVSGRFTIYDLPAGQYTLTLRDSAGLTAVRTVTVGSTTVNVVLVLPR